MSCSVFESRFALPHAQAVNTTTPHAASRKGRHKAANAANRAVANIAAAARRK